MTLPKLAFAAVAAAFAAAPALAESHAPTMGDAAAGADAFAKQCVSCHVVVNEAGETLAGRNAKTGPNLYGVAGRPIGSIEDFRYGDGIEKLHEAGSVWSEENFVGYVQDPTPWLREASGDGKVRGKMSFKVRSEEDAHNIYAYLFSLANPTN
jgi:cytochrome c